jgi:hypothetical protein
MVLVCSNHRRAIRRVDDPFDFGAVGFVMGQEVERLALASHVLEAG